MAATADEEEWVEVESPDHILEEQYFARAISASTMATVRCEIDDDYGVAAVAAAPGDTRRSKRLPTIGMGLLLGTHLFAYKCNKKGPVAVVDATAKAEKREWRLPGRVIVLDSTKHKCLVQGLVCGIKAETGLATIKKSLCQTIKRYNKDGAPCCDPSSFVDGAAGAGGGGVAENVMMLFAFDALCACRDAQLLPLPLPAPAAPAHSVAADERMVKTT